MSKGGFLPKAILFDMDGVIVDSMPYHFIAWYEALRPYGIRVNLFDIFTKEGEKWDKSLVGFLRQAGIVPSEKIMQDIFLARQKIFKKYFKRFIFQGAQEFVDLLKAKGFPLALVTGTPCKDIRKILPSSLYRAFDAVVGGDCVPQGKPHPGPYLQAAKKLKVLPGDCLVIENAPLGIISAKKAGMFCVAITTSLPSDYLGDADIIVDEFSQLLKCLSLNKDKA